MAKFEAAVLTRQGTELLAKVQAGRCRNEFTAMVTGAGVYADGEDVGGRTAMKDIRQRFGLSSVNVVNDTTVFIRAAVTNEGLKTGYRVNEIGLMAIDPDRGEILYALAVALNEQGDYLPSYNGMLPSENVVEFYTEVSSAASVELVAGSSIYALAKDVEDLRGRVTAEEQKTAGLEKAFGEKELAYIGDTEPDETGIFWLRPRKMTQLDTEANITLLLGGDEDADVIADVDGYGPKAVLNAAAGEQNGAVVITIGN